MTDPTHFRLIIMNMIRKVFEHFFNQLENGYFRHIEENCLFVLIFPLEQNLQR